MLIVDTGPLVSIADTKDRHYQSCLALLQSDLGPLVTTSLSSDQPVVLHSSSSHAGKYQEKSCFPAIAGCQPCQMTPVSR